MSDTPEISENLSQRIEAQRAALASLLAQSGVTASPAAAEGMPPRADVLLSGDANPWHDGRREEREEKKEEEKKDGTD